MFDLDLMFFTFELINCPSSKYFTLTCNSSTLVFSSDILVSYCLFLSLSMRMSKTVSLNLLFMLSGANFLIVTPKIKSANTKIKKYKNNLNIGFIYQ